MPAVDTVIDEADAPLHHNNVPVAVVESVELPQLFETVTTGVAGTGLGAAITLSGALVHPFTFIFKVYVPGLLTVIDIVVSPVFQNF